eukprot:5165831-Amphidinium_carterae.2
MRCNSSDGDSAPFAGVALLSRILGMCTLFHVASGAVSMELRRRSLETSAGLNSESEIRNGVV